MAARVRAGRPDGAEVRVAVPDPDPAGRPGPSRGVLAGRAGAGAPAPAPVPAHGRRAGPRNGGAGRPGAAAGRAAGDVARREAVDQAGRGGARGGVSWRGRAVARLLPPGRRDWAEAVWAEAREVPAGWQRLAWRAGGVRLIAKEAQIARRIGVPLLFAAAAAAAAWVAWPKSRVSLSHGAANQGDVIITLVLLAGLPLVTRLFLGPPGSRAARWLRAGFYAAILIIMLAKPVAELFIGTVPRGGIDLRSFDFITEGSPVPGSVSGGPDWGGEIIALFITACYLAVILALTARRAGMAPATLAIGARAGRAGMAPATLAIGARAGLLLGLVMYAGDPLGFDQVSSSPWLHGSATDPLVA